MSSISRRHDRVLVLGEESRVLLPIARSLAGTGAYVEVGWCPPHEIARHSRCVAEFVELPEDLTDDEWLDTVIDRHDREPYTAIIPATESAATAWHRSRTRWQGTLPVEIANDLAMRTALDKIATWELAQRLDVAVPAGVVVGDTSDPVRVAGDAGLGWPVVLKPASPVAADGRSKISVRVAENVGELRRAHVELIDRGAVSILLQERVPGVGVGVETVARDGELLAAFQHRRLHETVGFGSTYRVAERVRSDLLAASRRLGRAIELDGVAMFEFRHDGAGDDWWLMEINARFWGSLPLTVAAGVDVPRLLLDRHRETAERPLPGPYRVGLRRRDLLNDLRWTRRQLVRSSPAQGDDGWAVQPIGRWRAIGDLLRLVLPRDGIDSWTRLDPGPTLAELRRTAGLAIGRDV